MFKEFQFANPEYFYILLIIPLMIAWHWFKNNRAKAEIKLSTLLPFASTESHIANIYITLCRTANCCYCFIGNSVGVLKPYRVVMMYQ